MSHDPSTKQPTSPTRNDELTDDELMHIVGGLTKFPVGRPIPPAEQA
jgi:bacteriocin-like protein